jgi:protein-S-isoprenylcysteine O-methyltransferase Ste14
MVKIGNFFFKYRNVLFPIFALSIFIPSPSLFTEKIFGLGYYRIPFIAGLVIAMLGQTIRALTIGFRYIVRGGKNKKVYAEDLVTDGIFHHCRNPLYVGNILMLTGVGLLSNSFVFIGVIVPLFCFIYQAIVSAEENYLDAKFGSQYKAYRHEVNRWIPSLKGLGETMESMTFNWKRYIINEYNTVYLLLLSIPIVLLTHHPDVVGLPSDEKIKSLVTIFLGLSMIYLFVRYLKKSKRLTPKA